MSWMNNNTKRECGEGGLEEISLKMAEHNRRDQIILREREMDERAQEGENKFCHADGHVIGTPRTAG